MTQLTEKMKRMLFFLLHCVWGMPAYYYRMISPAKGDAPIRQPVGRVGAVRAVDQ